MTSSIFQPQATSPLSTWLSYIENLHSSAIDLGLERVSVLADRLDLVKPAPKVITVAGTNGKGSTCALMEAILIEAGYKVGVYSSPHLIDYKERVRINQQMLSDEAHVEAFAVIEQARQEVTLSFFEYATLAALYLFKSQSLDVLLLEVGLGGRLDATNIVEHDVSVITSLALDHTDWLGHDLEKIGYEKAGIFRSERPAICGQAYPPLSVEEHADNIAAELFQVGQDFNYQLNNGQLNHDGQSNNNEQLNKNGQTWQWQSRYLTLNELPIPCLPLANAATALMALSTSELSCSYQHIVDGLKKAKLAGRMQVLANEPVVLLDVAHNPQSAGYLAEQLTKHYAQKTIHVVVGMLKDKDIQKTLAQLAPIAQHWYLASLSGDRAANANDLKAALPHLTHYSQQGFADPISAYEAARAQAKSQDVIVIMGSFHTVGEVMAYWQAQVRS